jgi:hypothetical protein
MSRLLPIRRRPYTTAIRDCGVRLKWFSRPNSFFRPMKSIRGHYRPPFDKNPAYSGFTGSYGPNSVRPRALLLSHQFSLKCRLSFSHRGLIAQRIHPHVLRGSSPYFGQFCEHVEIHPMGAQKNITAGLLQKEQESRDSVTRRLLAIEPEWLAAHRSSMQIPKGTTVGAKLRKPITNAAQRTKRPFAKRKPGRSPNKGKQKNPRRRPRPGH